eukprot:TRINITY_DN5049_c0_g1_i1.p1 TRINITY_DN5049_c0_g1~~TRINITY_DN5049_c0_g1_i1.p1  ORF type:complete len:455 (+),score=102.37 TRINITY_DN5049_c0_g1_i1:195-1559(+)
MADICVVPSSYDPDFVQKDIIKTKIELLCNFRNQQEDGFSCVNNTQLQELVGHNEQKKAVSSLTTILPDEILVNILSYLWPSDLCALSAVCQQIRFIVSDNILWRSLYKSKFCEYRTEFASRFGWRRLYEAQSKTDINWKTGKYTSCVSVIGHSSAVRSVAYEGNKMITGGSDKVIRVWEAVWDHVLDKENGDESPQKSFVAKNTMIDNKMIRSFQADFANDIIVSIAMDSTSAKIWSTEKGQTLHTLEGQRGWMSCLALCPPSSCGGGMRVVTGALDGCVRLWDMNSGRNISSIMSGHESLRGVCVDGQVMMTSGTEKGMKLWDFRVPQFRSTVPACVVEGAASGNYCVQLSSHIVVSGSKGCVAMTDIRNPSTTKIMKGHTDVVSCLQLVGSKLVTGSMDHSVCIWDTNNSTPSVSLKAHSSFVWDLQFDENKLVTAGGDSCVKVWDFSSSY